MKRPLELFAVVKNDLDGLQIKAIFCEVDIQNAKLWFMGYLSEEKVKIDYRLYKIGEINEELKLKPYKIYVTNGQALGISEKIKEEKQLKLEILNKKKQDTKLKELEKMYVNGECDIEEVIKELFHGDKINEFYQIINKNGVQK